MNADVPFVVGVPLITPVAGASVSPAGSVPVVMDQVPARLSAVVSVAV